MKPITFILLALTISNVFCVRSKSSKISRNTHSRKAFQSELQRFRKLAEGQGISERLNPKNISMIDEPKCCTPEVYEIQFNMKFALGANEKESIMEEEWCNFAVDGNNKLGSLNCTTIYTVEPLPISMSYLYDGKNHKFYTINHLLDCSNEAEITFQNSGDWEGWCIPSYAQVLNKVTVGNGLLNPGVEGQKYRWFVLDGYSEGLDNGAGEVKVVVTKECTPIWDEFTGFTMDDDYNIGFGVMTTIYTNFHNGVRDPENTFRVPGPCPAEMQNSRKITWPSSKMTTEMKIKLQLLKNLIKKSN